METLMHIKENERIDDLQIHGLKIIQEKKGFCFGIDAVLLSNFVTVRKGQRGADLGTGTGIIPILIAGKSEVAHITAIEIQEEVADMARRSVTMNALDDRICVHTADLKEASRIITPNSLDFVTSNPPYMDGKGLTNENLKKKISRHEICCTLEDVIGTAAKLLAHGGNFFMVHRPSRLCDILTLARAYKLEPKLLRLVHPKPAKAPNLLLIKCVKAARPELKILDPLYVYQADGSYDDEILHTYSIEKLGEDDG